MPARAHKAKTERGGSKMNGEIEVTKEEFLRYEGVRVSGVTNMWAVNVVGKISGLSREKCFEIMKKYTLLADKYL